MLTVCILLYLSVVLYLVGAIVTYGISFAFWQRRYPEYANRDYVKDMIASIFFGVIWLPLIACKEPRKDLRNSFRENGLKFY